MLGADIGTSLMAVVFSFDLSWLSPLFIFVGVVLFITRQSSPVGPLRPGADRPGPDAAGAAAGGRVHRDHDAVAGREGAARLASPATCCWRSPSAPFALGRRLFEPGDRAAHRDAWPPRAWCRSSRRSGLVLGANLGSGLLAVLTTARPPSKCARCRSATWSSRLLGVLIAAPFVGLWLRYVRPYVHERGARGRAVPPGLQHAGGAAVHRPHAAGRALGGRSWLPKPRPQPGRRPAAPPRPFGAGDAVAGHLLRRARGAAPGRRGRDHADRHAGA